METECTTVLLLLWIECVVSYNVATSGSKQFVGSKEQQFGYQVQQLSDQRIVIGSPWSGDPGNRKGDVFRCDITSPGSACDKLRLPESIGFPEVRNVNVNMSLGLTLTRSSDGHFMACAPLWAQQCGSQYFLPGVCAKDNARPAIVPALQTCGGPVDIVIVLDGSNSIEPWKPVTTFLHRLIETMDIGPANTQVCIIQYNSEPNVEFHLNRHSTRESLLEAVAAITQLDDTKGRETNTFGAITYAREEAFRHEHGGRPGATKVMVVVTDGFSHDVHLRDENDVIKLSEQDGITRFGIAVLGYYTRNRLDTSDLIAEIKSIASVPSEQYVFNVADENALVGIAATLGDRISTHAENNIEGTGEGLQFKMEMSQVGFSAHQTRDKDTWLFGAVGAYDWSGTVVHQTANKTIIFPEGSFADILQERDDSSYLGYSVTTLYDGVEEYFVAGAPRSNHTGQVVVYTLNSRGQPDVLDSHRGEQLGSYYGGVLCSLDVDGDGTSDLLLVSAQNFMSPLKKQTGRVYLLSFSKGVLTDRGFLSGPSPAENSGFGQALAGAGDLDLDGYTDVVVGAPLEEDNKGVIYIYNGCNSTLRTQYSQKIRGSTLDSGLMYFGRSLDTTFDLNGDLINDITVGAYGKVVNLWSRPVAVVTATMTFDPQRLSLSDRPVSMATVCLTATFRPSTASGPLVLWYNITVDSRGTLDGEDGRRKEVQVHLENGTPVCHTHTVYAQKHPESFLPLSFNVTVSQPGIKSSSESSPVLDHYSTKSWNFQVPFAKVCGSVDVCMCDLSIRVKPSSSKLLLSYKNRRLSFEVSVSNAEGVDRAYNVRLTTQYSNNVYYSSVTHSHDSTVVQCDVTDMLTCVVGYPALMDGQEVTFTLNFDLGMDERPLRGDAVFTFNVLSDDTERQPLDNQATFSLPLMYDSELSLSRESNLNFYVSTGDAESGITKFTTLDDIGPKYNFTIKVSTGNFPVHECLLSIAFPSSTKAGNPLLFLTEVATQPSDDVTCDVTVDTMPISTSFSKKRLFGTKQLDCDTATCRPIKCVLNNMSPNRMYSISVNTRIWKGTFATALFQSIELTSTAHIETQQPELLIVTHPQITVGLSVTNPLSQSEVPVAVIAGSVSGGLLLLAMMAVALWKLGFFKRKKLEQNERVEEGEADTPQSNQE